MASAKPVALPPYTGTRIDRIGVVVPVKNEEQTLARCLDGLEVAASRVAMPVTVIVVLDACTDNSASVAAGFHAGGVRAITIEANNVGCARAAGGAEPLAPPRGARSVGP